MARTHRLFVPFEEIGIREWRMRSIHALFLRGDPSTNGTLLLYIAWNKMETFAERKEVKNETLGPN